MFSVLLPVTANYVPREWETYDYSRFGSQTFVYDIGGNFSNNIDLDHYNRILREMQAEYGITYVFVIVDDYNIAGDDDTVWDFAALIRERGGYSRDYVSVAITVGPGARDFAIYTSGNGQTMMTDRNVRRMDDALFNNLSANNWDDALRTFVNLSKEMSNSHFNRPPVDVSQIIIWAVIAGAAFMIILLIAELAKHKPVKKAVHADYYVDDKNVNMKVTTDSFLRTRETRTKISSSSSGGGGKGGGSSFRGGSSGRSGGGRSRRF
jgi:hypothetical protein